MREMRMRQVHLDFHTSPDIPDVGAKFDKKQFQKALKLGNLDSITVFAKCHHSMVYYPTEIGTVHPSLKKGFDLTGAMIDAAHEIGVAAPVYITVGWSDEDAYRFPECRHLDRNLQPIGFNHSKEEIAANPDLPREPYDWTLLCMSGRYAEHIYALTEEVCKRYKDLDGIFYDICYMQSTCYCENCRKEMEAAGLDPFDEEENRKNYTRVHNRFTSKCREILHRYHPEATIFFNGGANIYRPEYFDAHTHLEMEDLPTAWGGYDKFVPRAAVVRHSGKFYLGMTGKFHMAWGEFGGFKNADALKYELAMMGMHGSGCSVGDQMHPTGVMDEETYRIIGEGYRFYEKYQPWFFNADPTADVGVFLSTNEAADEGLHKMLLENQIDFDVVLPDDDFSKFKVLVLPDYVKLSDETIEKLKAFKGQIILSYESLLTDKGYALDTGVAAVEASPYDIDYIKVEKIPLWVKSPFLCYTPGKRLTPAADAETLASLYEPYFRRTAQHFCSHINTPYQPESSGYAAILRKGNVTTFAHPIFSLYFEKGAQLFRDVFISTLLSVYEPKCKAKFASAGRIHLTEQKNENRYVFHISYAQPISRGNCLVIEDVPEIRGVNVSVAVDKKIKAVREAGGSDLPFIVKEDGRVEFTVPAFRIYTAVELCY